MFLYFFEDERITYEVCNERNAKKNKWYNEKKLMAEFFFFFFFFFFGL